MIEKAIATLHQLKGVELRPKLAESNTPPDTSNMSDEIKYSVNGGIGILRVNRPEARNAPNWATQERFAEAVRKAAAESSLRTLIITGTGEKEFSTGGDLKELAGQP